MESTVILKNYDSVGEVNLSEVWRYAGYKGIPDEASEESQRLKKLLQETAGDFTFRVCFTTLPTKDADGCLPFASLKAMGRTSFQVEKLVADCDEMVLFAATIGTAFERKIAKYTRLEPASALLLHALGAERVEALADYFDKEFGKKHTPRFSPGYGDLPLEAQRDFFAFLNPEKNIGVTLGENLLMSPQKTITALFGIKKETL